MRTAAALLHAADGHFQAIVVLLQSRLYGSAFALLRPLIETSLRGAWAYHCDNDSAVAEAVQKDQLPMMMDAVTRLETLDAFSCGALSRILAQIKKALHSYTHGGTVQIANHLKTDAIEPSFSDAEIEEAMSIAAFFELFVAAHVALVGNNFPLAEKIAQEFDVVSKAPIKTVEQTAASGLRPPAVGLPPYA